jgi:alcohol dehydrogenase
MNSKEKAKELLTAWKGDSYIFGLDVLPQLETVAKKFGKKVLVISSKSPHWESLNNTVLGYMKNAGIEVATGGIVNGAKPNAPREDVYRLESYILHHKPDFLIVAGGGSSIDCVKAANVLAALGGAVTPEIDYYFGTGMVSEAYKKTGKQGLPLIAVETSASSGAHLTKYANITDPVAGQKKLIVDEAVIPTVPFFDYAVTASMPVALTIDGAFDAIAHTFEVFCGAKEGFDKAAELATTAIDLVVENAKILVQDPENLAAREAIGLATDLGGYAIMAGGTSGPHLTSFSLVDVVAHGTACGIMNPYYAVFYSKAIQKQLKIAGAVFAKHGYITKNLDALSGRDLALAFAEGMIAFAKSIGAPTKLNDLKGFSEEIHIKRALAAAKDPQLEMKLKNMPVPFSSAGVDTYMEPILRAGATGDMSLIVEM